MPIRRLLPMALALSGIAGLAGPAVSVARANAIETFQVNATGTCTTFTCASQVSITGTFTLDLTTGAVSGGTMTMSDPADLAAPVSLPFNLQSEILFNEFLFFRRPTGTGNISYVELIFPFSSFPSGYSGGTLCTTVVASVCGTIAGAGIGPSDQSASLLATTGGQGTDIEINSASVTVEATPPPPPPPSGRKIAFAPAITFPAGIHNPACIATGDFDRDGIQDFAVINHFNDLAVFLGNGDGTFKSPTNYSLDFYVQGCIAAADFDRDLKPDLAIVGGSHGLAFLKGRGDGTFEDPVYTETALAGGSISLAVGDFNKDGNLDIFVGGNGSSGELIGDGHGHFKDGQYVNGVRGLTVALGDFNHDGNLDVATPDVFSNTLYVLAGNGDGTFQTPVTYDVATQPYGVVATDLNRGGHEDLVVTTSEGGILLSGDGTGGFTQSGLLFSGFSPTNVIASDFNRDGNPDLATAEFQGDGVTVVTGQGRATCTSVNVVAPLAPPNCQPAPVTLYLPTGLNPTYVATADFNHDGSPDLVVANYGDGTISILLNEAGTYITAAEEGERRRFESEHAFLVSVTGSVLASVVPTGTITVLNSSGVVARATLVGGKAAVRVDSDNEGWESFVIFYSGDDTFNPNVSSIRRPLTPGHRIFERRRFVK